MNKLTVLITSCAMLVLGSGVVLGQERARGDRSQERSQGDASRGRPYLGAQGDASRGRPYLGAQGDASRGRPRVGAQGGWSRGPGHPYGYRGAPYPNRYYSYGIYAPPVARYYVPSYYEYPIYEPPVYITQEYVYPAPVLPPPPPPVYYQSPPLALATPPPQPAPQPAPAPRLERYTLSASELFEFDRSELRMPQPKLDEIAAVLSSNPQISNVHITGYTDRLGTDAYNLKLSQRRADAVKAYLIGKGVAANRLNATGRGEANPVVQCTETKRAALIKCLEPNRRVEVEQITIERLR